MGRHARTQETVEAIYADLVYNGGMPSRDIKFKYNLTDAQWMRYSKLLTDRAFEDGAVFGYHEVSNQHKVVSDGTKVAKAILEYHARQLTYYGKSQVTRVKAADRMHAITSAQAEFLQVQYAKMMNAAATAHHSLKRETA